MTTVTDELEQLVGYGLKVCVFGVEFDDEGFLHLTEGMFAGPGAGVTGVGDGGSIPMCLRTATIRSSCLSRPVKP